MPDYPTGLPAWGDPDETADEFYETQRKAQEILDQGHEEWLRWKRLRWPMPSPPPYAADDEGLEEPRDA